MRLKFTLSSMINRAVRGISSDRSFAEILSGSVWALSARIFATGLGVITNIIMARFYGAKAIGALAVINSLLGLVTIFTGMGTSISILRLIPEHIAKYSVTSAFHTYRRTQFLVAAASVVAGTVLFVSSGVIAGRVFSKPHLAYFVALASAFVLVKSLAELNTQAVRGLRLVQTYVFLQVVPGAAMLLILIFVTLASRNPANPIYSQFAALTVAAMISLVVATMTFRRRMRPGDTVREIPIRDICSISGEMLISRTMSFVIAYSGVVMLGIFKTETEVGYYSVALKLATLTAFVITAINAMTSPTFAHLYHDGKVNELLRIAKKSSRLIFWTSAPVLLVLSVGGYPILRHFFGHAFTAAYIPMLLLMIGQFVNSISGSTGVFMVMTGDEKALRTIMITSCAVNIALDVVLIPPLGISGAAIGTMVSLSGWNIAVLVFIKAKYGESIGYFPFLGMTSASTRRGPVKAEVVDYPAN